MRSLAQLRYVGRVIFPDLIKLDYLVIGTQIQPYSNLMAYVNTFHNDYSVYTVHSE
jgi:hypothetical protein